MKKLFFILLLSVATTSFAQVITPDALRREYIQVSKDSASCAKLYQRIIKSQANDNITMAYRGAITASMANHSKNKKEKLDLFNKGKKLMEQAITADGNNIETRFLRFSVQTICPKALVYNKQILSDKDFILTNFATTSNLAIKRMISSHAQQCKDYTEAEKQKLK